MKNIMVLIILKMSLLFVACQNQPEYVDMTSTEYQIDYYDLSERSFYDDNGVKISIKVPTGLVRRKNTINPNTIAFLESKEVVVYIQKLESANSTAVFDDISYNEIINNWFEDNIGRDLKKIEELMPSYTKDLKVHSFIPNLKINNKFFALRISSFKDERNIGTNYEGVMFTEYMFITYHEGRKYEVGIQAIGYKTLAEIDSYFQTIGGTTTFKL